MRVDVERLLAAAFVGLAVTFGVGMAVCLFIAVWQEAQWWVAVAVTAFALGCVVAAYRAIGER